ncbi:MAG: RecX family transcriptional regulator, partial [Alphaproteobacteria bacterium]
RPGKGRKPSRGPRRITPSYLENAALFYLERYATSVAHFRRVLMNKVRRSARFHGTDVEEGAKLVEDLIQRYRRSGLLDD